MNLAGVPYWDDREISTTAATLWIEFRNAGTLSAKGWVIGDGKSGYIATASQPILIPRFPPKDSPSRKAADRVA